MCVSKICVSYAPLHLTAQGKRVEMAEVLLVLGAELEVLSDHGETALLLAVRYQNVDIVRLLFDLNADTTKTDRNGWNNSLTPNTEIKQLLLEHSTKSVRRSFDSC